MARKREAIEVGTGDVFVDLGLSDAGERKLRVQLAMQVNELVARRRLTQRVATNRRRTLALALHLACRSALDRA